MLIDTHCHLIYDAFADDLNDVRDRARDADVRAIINPGTTLADSTAITAAAQEMPELFAAVGIHPNDAGDVDDQTIPALHALTTQSDVVAVGEIGLDYYWDSAPRPVQKQVFEHQLDLAKRVGLPVIIHQRDAADDTMAILREWARDGHPGLVLHAFSGDVAMAEEAIDLGFYIGIGGPVTFKNPRQLPDVVAATPLDRLLIETDAPYLTPHPFRGKRNEPARVTLVAQRLAELKSMSYEALAEQSTRNALALFSEVSLPNG